jgi:hypothetical protein
VRATALTMRTSGLGSEIDAASRDDLIAFGPGRAVASFRGRVEAYFTRSKEGAAPIPTGVGFIANVILT